MDLEVSREVSFGDFTLDAIHRRLFKHGEPISLNPKAFDLLATLVEHHGSVLSKSDLLDKVWPGQFVEENNLTVHIAALRKALGESKKEHKFIVTVPGKGYGFVAPLESASNGDVIVERRKVERIIIEEEIDEHTNGNGSRAGYSVLPAVTETAVPRRSRLVPAAAAVLLLGALLAAGFAFREPLARLVRGTVHFDEPQIRQLTTKGNVGRAALSPDGKLFVYTTEELGQKTLWLGQVDGGNHIQLTPAVEATYGAIVFSPDSTAIIYSMRGAKDAKFATYRMPVTGGVAVKLNEGISDFSLSPDGSRIAWGRTSGDERTLVVSKLDGSESRDIATFTGTRAALFETISWSADARKLALSVLNDGRMDHYGLAVVEVESGAIEKVPTDGYRQVTETAWLADGSGLLITAIEEGAHSSVPQYRVVHVAYPSGETRIVTNDRSNYGESWHNDAGVTLSLSGRTNMLLAVEHRQLSNVWVAPADDLAAARQVTHGSFGKYDGLWGLDWAPDGSMIYTTSDTQGQFLARMNADGTGQRDLTSAGHVDSVLTVATDGRYILYHSNRPAGDFDIWRANLDGSDPTQLTFGGKGFQCAPSPDGKWVYYKSWLDGVGELRRVPINGGKTEAVTDKETSWPSFSPDGKFFAAAYKTDKTRLAIFLSENGAVLKQFDIPATGTLFMGSRWTPDGSAVAFRDNAYGYWIQPIDGGSARRLEGLPNERLYNFSWSKDGKWFAFVRGQEIRDVVVLK